MARSGDATGPLGFADARTAMRGLEGPLPHALGSPQTRFPAFMAAQLSVGRTGARKACRAPPADQSPFGFFALAGSSVSAIMMRSICAATPVGTA